MTTGDIGVGTAASGDDASTGVAAGFRPYDGETPEGLVMWVREVPVPCAGFDDVPVSVVVESGETWAGVDVEMLTGLPVSIDTLLAAALAEVRAELRRDPSVFGLDAEAAGAYLAAGAAGLGLDLPEVVFHADGTWLLRFAQGDFPVCDPYGLAVLFAGSHPLRVMDLSDSVEIG